MSRSPYDNLLPERFWRTGVSQTSPETVENFHKPKFALSKSDRIATAGSCFAQHIARYLREKGCNVLDVEPAPDGVDAVTAKRFGYGLYSARYGNVYTVRQLRQLIDEARGRAKLEDTVWTKGDRYFDALRPGVEPEGLESAEEVTTLRQEHLGRVKQLFKKADVFIFTLGLTEAWVHRASGTVFPTAPGTIAGDFDPDSYAFKNFTTSEIVEDLVAVRSFLKKKNPNARILLTVSPVPLTATADDRHVLVATMYSKSTLRSACGEIASRFDDVDYFPSYELIASHFSRGRFFEDNMRSVAPEGVETVMRVFFDAYPELAEGAEKRPGSAKEKAEGASRKSGGTKSKRKAAPAPEAAEDLVCEEALLEAFAK